MEDYEGETLNSNKDRRNDKFRGHNKRKNFREVKERYEKTASRFSQKMESMKGMIDLEKERLEEDRSRGGFEIQRLNAKVKNYRRLEEKANSLYFYLETHTEHHPRNMKSMMLTETKIKNAKREMIQI